MFIIRNFNCKLCKIPKGFVIWLYLLLFLIAYTSFDCVKLLNKDAKTLYNYFK